MGVSMFRIFVLTLIVWGLFLLYPGRAEEQKNYYGDISVTLNKTPTEIFSIQRALLFRSVSIDYDSTALIQDKSSETVLFYPQLSAGTDNILRLIFGKENQTPQHYFDLFINFGDTIPDSLEWEDEEDKIFLAYDGIAQPRKPHAKKISGKINIIRNPKTDAVSGSLHLGFKQALLIGDSTIYNVQLEGGFDVPVGEYRSTSMSTIATREKRKNYTKNNIAIAMLISAFIIAIFGLR